MKWRTFHRSDCSHKTIYTLFSLHLLEERCPAHVQLLTDKECGVEWTERFEGDEARFSGPEGVIKFHRYHRASPCFVTYRPVGIDFVVCGIREPFCSERTVPFLSNQQRCFIGAIVHLYEGETFIGAFVLLPRGTRIPSTRETEGVSNLIAFSLLDIPKIQSWFGSSRKMFCPKKNVSFPLPSSCARCYCCCSYRSKISSYFPRSVCPPAKGDEDEFIRPGGK